MSFTRKVHPRKQLLAYYALLHTTIYSPPKNENYHQKFVHRVVGCGLLNVVAFLACPKSTALSASEMLRPLSDPLT